MSYPYPNPDPFPARGVEYPAEAMQERIMTTMNAVKASKAKALSDAADTLWARYDPYPTDDVAHVIMDLYEMADELEHSL